MSKAEDIRQMRDAYLSHVTALFDEARKWIHGFDPGARIEEESISIREESVGSYDVPTLVIHRPGCKTVRLIPRGRWIIGAEGRVDMKSDLGTETLVYDSERDSDIRIDEITENGKRLGNGESHSPAEAVAEGWFFVQNRQIGMLPALDASLFRRLLEVLGR